MASPLPTEPPAERVRAPEPTHYLHEGSFTPEELAVMDEVDPVNVDAALSWMLDQTPGSNNHARRRALPLAHPFRGLTTG